LCVCAALHILAGTPRLSAGIYLVQQQDLLLLEQPDDRWNTGLNKVDSGYLAAITSQGWPGAPDSPDASFFSLIMVRTLHPLQRTVDCSPTVPHNLPRLPGQGFGFVILVTNLILEHDSESCHDGGEQGWKAISEGIIMQALSLQALEPGVEVPIGVKIILEGVSALHRFQAYVQGTSCSESLKFKALPTQMLQWPCPLVHDTYYPAFDHHERFNIKVAATTLTQ